MSEIIVYDQIPQADLTAAINSLGDHISKSGFAGCSNLSQGQLLAWECFARRTTAMSLIQQFHIIGNKLSMKSDAMLAEFRRIGGKHKIITRTPEKAEVDLTFEGNTDRFSFTWEQALQEPYVWDCERKVALAAIASGQTKKLTLNPNYASPRKRMQMLWARVISDGIRATVPDVNFGRYAPEDLEDGDDDERPVVQTQSNGKPKKPTTPKTPVTPTTPEASQPGEVIDAEYEVTPDANSDSTTPQKSKLIEAIRTHWQQLGATLDDQAAMIGKERCGRPGAAALVGLDVEQLTDLEAKLRGAVDHASTQEEVPFDIDEEPTGPISDIQIAAAKELIQKLQATEPLITDTIKEQLAVIGKAKLSELSAAQANVLISDLKKGDTKLSGAAMYFQESLQPVPHYATEAGN
jgi:hypothetical protein